MTTIIFCVAAFIGTLTAANRSLRGGLLALLAVGYGYGILRANFPDTATYMTFDAAVLAFYIGQLWRPLTTAQRIRTHDLRLWVTALMAWPIVLFFAFPTDSPLVELVGLRANIFLIPFLLIGTRLDQDDLLWLAKGLAALNLAVVSVGVAEFFLGIGPFYPFNEVTELIYRSKDLVGRTVHRIPGTFSSAHAFAGTMVMSLPLLIGAWVQIERHDRWVRRLLAVAIVASLLGVFMAAARTHMITAALLVAIVTFSGHLRGDQWVRWVVALAMVAYVVSGEERLQRFTTLQDTDFISERWTGSVNEGFFEALKTYPLGNGLAGGGTSVPYFLRGNQSPLIMENEYARIGIEEGLPGLTLWVAFIGWAFLRWPARGKDPWALGRLLGWVTCGVLFFSGLTGVGLLSSVPQTVLMLITMGWFAGRVSPAPVGAFRRALSPSRREPVVANVQSVEPAANG